MKSNDNKIDSVLLITAEKFPTHESFLTEVYSKNDILSKVIFLMRSPDTTSSMSIEKWNFAKVYVIPSKNKIKFLRSIETYFKVYISFAYIIPYIVYKEKISILQVRDTTFPLFISLLLKIVCRKKVVYQKSFPHELREMDSDFVAVYKNPAIKRIAAVYGNKLLHFMLRYCDAILPISAQMSNDLHRDYKLPLKKMFPFGMGFNFNDYIGGGDEQTIPGDNYELRIIYVGAHARREISVLLKGIQIALGKIKGRPVKFDFYGGSVNEVQKYESLARDLVIHEYCTFAGQISRSEVYKKISNSHIGLAWVGKDRRYWMASPTKTIEYLSLGVPVIATDSVHMHSSLLEETQAGVICKAEAEDFADKLMVLLDSISIYQGAAVEAKTYMEKKYSYASMRCRVQELYSNL